MATEDALLVFMQIANVLGFSGSVVFSERMALLEND